MEVLVVALVLVGLGIAGVIAVVGMREETVGLAGPTSMHVYRLLDHRTGPALLATVLAMLSLPLVALSLDAVSTSGGLYRGDEPIRLGLLDPGRWSGAFGAVLAAAVVAGAIGGPLVLKHAKIGGLVTLVLAWEVAIAALTVVPSLLRMDVGFAYTCLDSCSPAIAAKNPDGILFLLVQPWTTMGLAPLVAPLPMLTLMVGVAVWVKLLRSSAGLRTRLEVERYSAKAVNERSR